MNIYSCWYRGTPGYGCKLGRQNWMFVPDLGQSDNHIYKNICLSELMFRNKLEYRYELDTEKTTGRYSLLHKVLSVFFPFEQPHTIGGLLFLPQHK